MLSDRLTTERLELRPIERADAGRVFELMSNWNVVRMLAMPPFPYSREDADVFITRRLALRDNPDDTFYAVSVNGELAGGIGVNPNDNVGYWLGEPYWGRGYMTEALTAVVAEFFRSKDADRLTSGVFVDNPASLAVQRKLGFEVVGERTGPCLSRGGTVRQIETEIRRDVFEALPV